MKGRVLNILAMVALVALMASPIVAQAQSVEAKIPFDFVVADRALPAGVYTLQCKYGGASVLMLWGVDQNVAHIALTIATITPKTLTEGKLVFHRYGNSYFLAEVWRAGSWSGAALPPSKTEREMAARVARGATTEIAVR